MQHKSLRATLQEDTKMLPGNSRNINSVPLGNFSCDAKDFA